MLPASASTSSRVVCSSGPCAPQPGRIKPPSRISRMPACWTQPMSELLEAPQARKLSRGQPKPWASAACQRGQCGPVGSETGARCPTTRVDQPSAPEPRSADRLLELLEHALVALLRGIAPVDEDAEAARQ